MRLLLLSLVGGAIAIAAPAARADVVAAVDVASPSGTNSDIALYDFSTSAKLSLPSGVNTAANELHPSMDASGRHLVFQRTAADGSRQIVMVDRSTGRVSDLFTTSEAALIRPTTPTITPDGSTVFTGQESAGDPSGLPVDRLEKIDVTGFPAASYPKAVLTGTLSQPAGTLTTYNPAALSPNAAEWTAATTGITSDGTGFGFTPTVFGNAFHVALDPANRGLAVIDPGGPTGTGRGDLRVVNLSGGATVSQGTALAVANTATDESRPAFTRDGRYLAFMRGTAHGEELHVIDTLQGGANVAPAVRTGRTTTQIRSFGNVSLVLTRPLVKSTRIARNGTISASLAQAAPVDILVQRIVGHRDLLGDVEPTVKTVGVRSFGRHRKGRLALPWDFAVRGMHLKRGRYLVTLRALDRKSGRPRDLARPVELLVRQ